MDHWQACVRQTKQQTLKGQLIRVVESQEQVATNNLVDTLEEQHLLEDMLENNKPPAHTDKLHYLLATPFRYPPLKYGSRFGEKTDPSLLYGSKTLSTALSETAYYRLLFWQGMDIAPDSGKFTTQHTIFGASYYSKKAYALHQPPFDSYKQQLASPDSYQASQQLSTYLRKAGTEVIEFTSARDSNQGINIALFTPQALSKKTPDFQQQWLCDTKQGEVAFYSASSQEYYKYPLEQYLVDEKLPSPAT